MRKLLSVLLAGALVIGLAGLVWAGETKLILATGGTAGTYYPFGGGIAKIWNSKIPGMNVTAQSTGASVENVRLVNRKEAELALVQSDTIDFAYFGKEMFKEPLPKLAAVAVLYPEILQIVVRGDSDAKSFNDLKGKRVGVGAPGSGTEANFRQLMDVYGLKKDDVRAQYLSFAESANQFKDNQIDAFFVVAGIPNAAIMEIATTRSIRILPIEGTMASILMAKYPFLGPAVVPANTYKGQTSDVTTVAVKAVLIANAELPEGVVYSLTRTLFENQPELAATHAKGKELDLKSATKGVSIPFHPGAVRYYKEKEIM
jgi:hypothetical protein